MESIAAKYDKVFQGMGRVDTEPIHIQMKNEATKTAQLRRPVPHQFREAVAEKLKYMVENDLIEGLLPPGECKGWIHNIVVTKKSWDLKEVRINVDTKRMNNDIVKTKTEELRHDLEGSDRFSALDCRDSFFHFLLDEVLQDLFKFHGMDGVYRFKDDILIHGKGQQHNINL